ncbi:MULTISPECIES: C40 family peptidase [Dyella]|uniref:NlpC/P60 family protein n=3 Tax=Dyella TaxID=231454 RepID=A0A4R0YZB3_9GAMM|nr:MULTISPECIES: C40 family peptidase [Dyella]TBR40020.1 NlpC/P60 family protein [Dyella terrae]TCI12398.1 NlpC/P60 family protein [Dyella soli]
MPIKRLTVNSVLVAALLASAPLFASPSQTQIAPAVATVTPSLQNQLSIFAPAPVLSQSVLPAAPAIADSASSADIGDAGMANASDLRKTLIGLAMKLRDIRYVRGGRDPSTGFDCSGFVRYVFAHAVGMELPANSASQFLAGLKVNRSEMKPGDLVFFRTAGRRGQGRISHVGIYIANGQFIHSPSRGKTVRVDSLEESYWAKRFAGAKRPEAMAQNG